MKSSNYNEVLAEVKKMVWPSQAAFAPKIGLSQQYLSKIICGQVPISPKLLKLLGYKKVKADYYVRNQ
jgi:hypothetical protein